MGSWFIAGQSKQFDDLKEATDWLKV